MYFDVIEIAEEEQLPFLRVGSIATEIARDSTQRFLYWN